jgi:hypothetical protein
MCQFDWGGPTDVPKENLSVVSAIAKAYPATGPPVMLLAHESPLNPDADFTLLSEYTVTMDVSLIL